MELGKGFILIHHLLLDGLPHRFDISAEKVSLLQLISLIYILTISSLANLFKFLFVDRCENSNCLGELFGELLVTTLLHIIVVR